MSKFRGSHSKLLERIDDLWNGGDLDVIPELYTADFTANGQQIGNEGVEGFLHSLRSGFPDMSFELTHQVGEGDEVALRFVQRGTHTGTWESPVGPLEPTGKTFEIGGIEIFLIKDGKAAEAWVEYDLLALLQQLGAV